MARRLICAAAALPDGGRGVRFRIDAAAPEEKGFAVRWMGRVHGFVNRCPHVGTELDWEPAQFFDLSGLYLVCSTHGALFEPSSGLCVAGPCRGACLEPLAIREEGGEVFLDEPAPAADTISAHD